MFDRLNLISGFLPKKDPIEAAQKRADLAILAELAKERRPRLRAVARLFRVHLVNHNSVRATRNLGKLGITTSPRPKSSLGRLNPFRITGTLQARKINKKLDILDDISELFERVTKNGGLMREISNDQRAQIENSLDLIKADLIVGSSQEALINHINVMMDRAKNSIGRRVEYTTGQKIYRGLKLTAALYCAGLVFRYLPGSGTAMTLVRSAEPLAPWPLNHAYSLLSA